MNELSAWPPIGPTLCVPCHPGHSHICPTRTFLQGPPSHPLTFCDISTKMACHQSCHPTPDYCLSLGWLLHAHPAHFITTMIFHLLVCSPGDICIPHGAGSNPRIGMLPSVLTFPSSAPNTGMGPWWALG